MRRKAKKRLKILISTLLVGAGLVALLGGILVIITLNSIPSLDLLKDRQITESTKIYDRTGETLLFEIYDEEKRTLIPFEQIPELVKQATIAIEDSNFYNHSAFDFRGFFRALWVNAKAGKIVQGGSTITQQLAKNVFLSPERTFTRKFKELILAYKLESAFSKDEVLSLYLNQIPYGSNAYGVESASRTFFKKPVEELTLSEIALLVSLPQAPSFYSPYGSHVDRLMARKNIVLEQMYKLGDITETQKLEAQEQEIVFKEPANLLQAPHFVIAVKEYLNNQFGEDFVRRSGLQVITTLNSSLQEIAEKAVLEGAQRNEELYKGRNSALVAQDTETGQVLALVGSRNYFDKEIDGNFNVATQGLRQPGSALKPFAYLTALEMGYPADTVLFDVETEFNASGDPEKNYSPENYSGDHKGPVSFREALSQSINIPAVKTLYLVGIQNLLDTLESFGITTLTDPRRYGLSLVLGGGEVHLAELVGAYSALAQEGVYSPQTMILKITNNKGEVLEEYTDSSQTILAPGSSRIINDILSDVKARSHLFSGSLNLTVFPGHDVAIKTGTTNDYRDAWAIGYTPSLAVGVWAGNNNNDPMERRGGSILAAVPILHSFLSEALLSFEAESFSSINPKTSGKTMLNGEYLDTSSGYPQVHSILHYVNKRSPLGSLPLNPQADSQYELWEEGVSSWALEKLGPQVEIVQLISPINNSQVSKDNTSSVFVYAIITSPKPLVEIKTWVNDTLVEVKNVNGQSSLVYQVFINTATHPLQSQNTIKIEARDISGQTYLKESILLAN